MIEISNGSITISISPANALLLAEACDLARDEFSVVGREAQLDQVTTLGGMLKAAALAAVAHGITPSRRVEQELAALTAR